MTEWDAFVCLLGFGVVCWLCGFCCFWAFGWDWCCYSLAMMLLALSSFGVLNHQVSKIVSFQISFVYLYFRRLLFPSEVVTKFTIVVDNGSGRCKAEFIGDDAPRAVSPSIVAPLVGEQSCCADSFCVRRIIYRSGKYVQILFC